MTTHNLTIDDIPDLPGYMTVAAVCQEFGRHRNTIYRMVFEQDLFPGAVKVMFGNPGAVRDPDKSFDDRKFVLLLPTQQVRRVMAERERQSAAPRPPRAALNAWHRRVREWGRASGWDFAPIKKVGRPHSKLISDYVKAHPGDPCPSMTPNADAIMAG